MSIEWRTLVMRTLKIITLLGFALLLLVPAGLTMAVEKQSTGSQVQAQAATEAPAGFDNQTNGFSPQSQFDADKDAFDEHEDISKGLGPLYNAQGCSECHGNPTSGGISQVIEVRAGHFDGVKFIDHPGGSLINSRAIDASIQEHILDGNEVRAFRTSLNTLGDGFVEAIADSTIIGIAHDQPGQSRGRISGQVIMVPVLESPGTTRVARFGWKNQHGSLLS